MIASLIGILAGFILLMLGLILGVHSARSTKMSDEEIKIIKSIVALNKIVDKLEQRISTLEKVLASHAKCIGEMREEKKDDA